jgi:hypothetical protein
MNANSTAQRSESGDQSLSSILKTVSAQNDKVNISKLGKTQVVSAVQQNRTQLYNVTFIVKF